VYAYRTKCIHFLDESALEKLQSTTMTFEVILGHRMVHGHANKKQVIAPGGDDMPPPMAVRLATDLRPSAGGSAVRTPVVAKLQAASVPVA